MKLLTVAKANDGKHKYAAVFEDDSGKRHTTKFGAQGMDDYTLTHDRNQRARYRARHAKDLMGDATHAGYLSYYLLWGDSTSLQENISAYKRQFHL